MEKGGAQDRLPLAEVEEPEELKRRYGIFSDETLASWIPVVTGPHRAAMEALLKERQEGRSKRPKQGK